LSLSADNATTHCLSGLTSLINQLEGLRGLNEMTSRLNSRLSSKVLTLRSERAGFLAATSVQPIAEWMNLSRVERAEKEISRLERRAERLAEAIESDLSDLRDLS